MPAEGFATLSSLKDEHIFVMCLDCEMLRRLDYEGLASMYDDVDLIMLKARIAKDIIKCEKDVDGYHNRCRLRFYRGHETVKITYERPASPSLESLCSWHIVVGKCRYCSHVSNIARWRVSKVTKPGMTLDDLKKLLRCSKCNHKGHVELSVAKLPR
ncbi:UNVERIFIED_ORG: hypothetical protein J2W66_002859 [Agrobacterium larrymoorei]|uniref:hypothetical protein n=1 Tax=Agrobacterium cavarae TaxID=2528239 RepID=UPI002789F095|nr:hypothetical protein [Agrobacterium larrymoorei]